MAHSCQHQVTAQCIDYERIPSRKALLQMRTTVAQLQRLYFRCAVSISRVDDDAVVRLAVLHWERMTEPEIQAAVDPVGWMDTNRMILEVHNSVYKQRILNNCQECCIPTFQTYLREELLQRDNLWRQCCLLVERHLQASRNTIIAWVSLPSKKAKKDVPCMSIRGVDPFELEDLVFNGGKLDKTSSSELVGPPYEC